MKKTKKNAKRENRLLAMVLTALMLISLLSGCGGAAGSASAPALSSASSEVTPEPTPELPTSELKAGAGSGEIVFSDKMYPMPEGFVKAHDNPHARVLVLENTEKVAIVSLELANAPTDSIDMVKQVVNEKTGTPLENIWVHSTHVLCAPHAPDDADARSLFNDAVTAAITEAAQEAADSFQEAFVGFGTGECDITVNRDIPTADGWTWGIDGDGTKNTTMTVMKVESLTGETIGVLFSYGTRSVCADVSRGTSDREITSDLTGFACTMLEEEFDAPALYCMPAAADQIPREAAVYSVVDEKGAESVVDLGVAAGLEIASRLGKEMGEDAIGIAKEIECTDDGKVAHAVGSFSWATKDGSGEMSVGIETISIGENAFVAVKPEINCVTELQLKEASPYKNTLLMTFVNGDQSYMPDSEAYDKHTFEWKKTSLAQGAAEEFVATASALLAKVHDGSYVAANAGEGSGAAAVTDGETITLGGIDWRVIAKEDGKALVLSEKVLTTMGYYAAGGSVTWEVSDVRAYLNGEFFDKTFTDAEKATILETMNVNKSSPQYGSAGGNDTTDKVFLLSCEEAEAYLGSAEARIGLNAETNEAIMWLLRTPGKSSEYVSDVNTTGYIDYHGILAVDAAGSAASEAAHGTDYASENGGIRPAMWISLG